MREALNAFEVATLSVVGDRRAAMKEGVAGRLFREIP